MTALSARQRTLDCFFRLRVEMTSGLKGSFKVASVGDGLTVTAVQTIQMALRTESSPSAAQNVFKRHYKGQDGYMSLASMSTECRALHAGVNRLAVTGRFTQRSEARDERASPDPCDRGTPVSYGQVSVRPWPDIAVPGCYRRNKSMAGSTGWPVHKTQWR